MAISEVQAKGANNSPGSATTMSITGFTCSGNPDSVLYVAVFCNTTTEPNPSVVWDAAGANQSLTKIAEEAAGNTIHQIFRLINPTDGANKTISLSSLSTSADIAIAVCFSGVDSTTPNGTMDKVEASGTTATSGTITSGTGDWIVSFIHTEADKSASITQQGGAPVVIQNTFNNNATLAYDNDQDGVDDTMDWAWTTSTAYCVHSFNLNVAASGGAAVFYPVWSRAIRLIAARS